MKVYGAKNKDDNIRMLSTSGGIFTALAEVIFDMNGIVIGATWDNLDVKHIAVDNKEDLAKLRKSKYVTSKVDYSLIKTDRPLLFSGTPCQMPKLKDNQYAIDFICNGTIKPELFKKYCEEEGITEIDFRDGTKSWINFHVKTNKASEHFMDNPFVRDFIHNKILEDKCYNCQFKNFKSQSDLMLGDFWGVQFEYSDFFDDKGVSVVFVRTEKGKKIFDLIKDKIDYIEVEYEKVLKYNPNITWDKKER